MPPKARDASPAIERALVLHMGKNTPRMRFAAAVMKKRFLPLADGREPRLRIKTLQIWMANASIGNQSACFAAIASADWHTTTQRSDEVPAA